MSIGAIANFKRAWQHQTITQMATFAVLLGSFVVLAMALLVHQNFRSQLAQWGESVKVSVYLKEDVEAEQLDGVRGRLADAGFFKEVKYISKDEAFVKFRDRMSQHIPWLAGDDEFDNPLPASYEAAVDGGLGNGYRFDKLVDLINELRVLPAVDEVSYGQGWIENYASVLKVFSTTTTVFLLTLLLGSLFVVGNSIRSSIAQRREEIEIMELCGATRRMILWPFVFEGLIMGLISSVAALVLAYVLYKWQAELFSSQLTFWSFKIHFEFLNWMRVLLVLVIGSMIGGLGSYLWARKLASGWSAAEATAK